MEINSFYYYRTLSINLVGGAYEYAIIPPCRPSLSLCVWKALVEAVGRVLHASASFATTLCSLRMLMVVITAKLLSSFYVPGSVLSTLQ